MMSNERDAAQILYGGPTADDPPAPTTSLTGAAETSLTPATEEEVAAQDAMRRDRNHQAEVLYGSTSQTVESMGDTLHRHGIAADPGEPEPVSDATFAQWAEEAKRAPDFAEVMDDAGAVFRRIGGPRLSAALNRTGLSNKIEFLRGLATLAKPNPEDSLVSDEDLVRSREGWKRHGTAELRAALQAVGLHAANPAFVRAFAALAPAAS